MATSYTSRHYYAMSIVGWPQPPEEWVKPIDMWSWQILWNLHKWLILFFTKPVSQLSLESVLHPVERNICTFLKFDTLFPHEQKNKNNNNKRKEGTKSWSTCSMIGVPLPLPLPRHCVTCCSFGRSFNACYEISISGKKPLGRLSDECAHEKTQQKKWSGRARLQTLGWCKKGV